MMVISIYRWINFLACNTVVVMPMLASIAKSGAPIMSRLVKGPDAVTAPAMGYRKSQYMRSWEFLLFFSVRNVCINPMSINGRVAANKGVNPPTKCLVIGVGSPEIKYTGDNWIK